MVIIEDYLVQYFVFLSASPWQKVFNFPLIFVRVFLWALESVLLLSIKYGIMYIHTLDKCKSLQFFLIGTVSFES